MVGRRTLIIISAAALVIGVGGSAGLAYWRPEFTFLGTIYNLFLLLLGVGLSILLIQLIVDRALERDAKLRGSYPLQRLSKIAKNSVLSAERLIESSYEGPEASDALKWATEAVRDPWEALQGINQEPEVPVDALEEYEERDRDRLGRALEEIRAAEQFVGHDIAESLTELHAVLRGLLGELEYFLQRDPADDNFGNEDSIVLVITVSAIHARWSALQAVASEGRVE